ncbi:flagellar hook-associated protein FlgL [Pseudomonas sp. ZM23]|uniref:Flagellar hook-associated protein FlgL n=1 Tax=Pseudomonas triclosanedens TaxID=2961893 RepID=A0ABY7A5R8_9PSED|nr:flagellar hook-associated protein FlgL [Pseudomonas triclosanedens]MCP8464846.1 flagellar hook-associated protein FlgL [Pseudomonas triclosanedens]MCP8470441.1 flagellar hook-associated protein FlgL [Pseudomonas triclosanedens]MCP8476247.1 flagellar hook-associated protein FlgL [Pseudomonas triclosanedens]WAI51520.1 flagellar hook-associated protein FlgL [Pseudomonas triclosanedens]
MRISTIQAYNNSVSGLQRNYSSVTRTQEQISTGKRILTPADDPVASVRLLQLSQEQALNDQYKSNITAAKNSLTSEEAVLQSVGNVIQRIREIAVEAGNGAQDSSDKNSLATELAQREDELMNLLNSKDASGKYLFSGSQGDTQPFVRNPDGTYTYQGDESQRQVQIASSTFLGISDSGKLLFDSANNVNRVTTGSGGTNTGTGRISLGLVNDKQAYDGTFPSSVPPAATDGIGIRFLDDKNYEVYDLNDPALPGSYTPLKTGAIDDNPQTNDFIEYGGVKVQIDGKPATGDTFTINRDPSTEKKGLLNVVADLRKALSSATDDQEGNYRIRDATAVAISNLDSVNTQVLSGQGKIGARLNVIDSTETFIDDVKLVNTGVISDLQDLDYAEALSRLSMQSTILQAAQQSYVKISGLSLFNYLN